MARLTALMAYSLTPNETSRPSTMEYRENTISEAAEAVTKRTKSERRLFPSSCKLTNPFLFPHPGRCFRCAASGPPGKVTEQDYTTTAPTAVNPALFAKTPAFPGSFCTFSDSLGGPLLKSFVLVQHRSISGLTKISRFQGFQLVPGLAFGVGRKQKPARRGVNIIMSKHILYLIHGRYLLWFCPQCSRYCVQ